MDKAWVSLSSHPLRAREAARARRWPRARAGGRGGGGSCGRARRQQPHRVRAGEAARARGRARRQGPRVGEAAAGAHGGGGRGRARRRLRMRAGGRGGCGCVRRRRWPRRGLARESTALRVRSYGCIGCSLSCPLLLLAVEVAAYLQWWHLEEVALLLAVDCLFVASYAGWMRLRLDYLAPPLQFLTNACSCTKTSEEMQIFGRNAHHTSGNHKIVAKSHKAEKKGKNAITTKDSKSGGKTVNPKN
uniref:Glucosyltransferase-like protein n=1 Tax=Oryza sativa subsp. japonica TaxID=39947 RepID=Q67TM0_ORYSJ|nr:glucosyltransferase-like protein [Oryza sativa Japonica Group]